MQIGINGYEEGKGQGKEALFNVANHYSSLGHEMTLRHNKYPFTDTYLTLSSYHHAVDASINKGAASTILTTLVYGVAGIRTDDLLSGPVL